MTMPVLLLELLYQVLDLKLHFNGVWLVKNDLAWEVLVEL